MTTMGAQRVKLSSEDQFIQEAIRSGRATIQKYSLKQLTKLDKAMQPRVNHLNVEHAKNLTDILQNLKKLDRDLDPGVLFRDPKTNWIGLVDGWHRLHAYMTIRPKLDYFPAYVVEGTKEEAIEYAAMANQHARLRRTPEDVEKQLRMLFALPKWWNSSNWIIAEHVGVGRSTVHKHRAKYSSDTGVPLPEEVLNARGQVFRKRVIHADIRSGRARPKIFEASDGSCMANVGGRLVRLGSKGIDNAEKVLDAKLPSVLGDYERSDEVRRVSLKTGHLIERLASGGFYFRSTGVGHTGCGIVGLTGCGTTAVTATLAKRDASATLAIGRVLSLREYDNPTHRAVVVCYPEDGPEEILDLGRRLGIEFLTPEQLVASIKGDSGDEQGTPAPVEDGPDPDDGLDSVIVQTADQFLNELHAKDVDGGDGPSPAGEAARP
jgi:hypothetical protein